MKLRLPAEAQRAQAGAELGIAGGATPPRHHPSYCVGEPPRWPRRDDQSAARCGHLVHELRLRRRRSHVPWVYVVYHRRETSLGVSFKCGADLYGPQGGPLGGGRDACALGCQWSPRPVD